MTNTMKATGSVEGVQGGFLVLVRLNGYVFTRRLFRTPGFNHPDFLRDPNGSVDRAYSKAKECLALFGLD